MKYIILTAENFIAAGSVTNHKSSSCFVEESENFLQLAAAKTQLVQKILGERHKTIWKGVALCVAMSRAMVHRFRK